MHCTIARFAIIATLTWSAAAAVAQTVAPPPLPPGSDRVRLDPGLNEEERKRYVRAHHHKAHHKKDYTRDDSVYGTDAHPGRKPETTPGQAKKK